MSNHNLIRNKNLELLKVFLFQQQQAFKAEMSKETGISVVTINSLVKQLVDENVLLEGELMKQALGRPAIRYHFNYDQAHYLLLSIQEKKVAEQRKLILVGKIVNLAGTEKYQKTIDFAPVSLAFLMDTIQQFLALEFPIERIGLSFPGKVYNGTVLSSWENLFDGWQIEAALAQRTSLPIIIQNDAHLLTVGYAIRQRLMAEQTLVGIFYPESSMPGITIVSNGTLIEGGRNLAGEAKFLPHLLQSPAPKTAAELVNNLLEILAIYNAVIAPDAFVLSAESAPQPMILEAVEQSSLLAKQLNKPKIFFVDPFQDSLTYGLRWLAMRDTIYTL